MGTNIHVRGRKLGLIISPTIRIQVEKKSNSFATKTIHSDQKKKTLSSPLPFFPPSRKATNQPTNRLSHQRSFRRVISRVYLLCASEGLSLKKRRIKTRSENHSSTSSSQQILELTETKRVSLSRRSALTHEKLQREIYSLPHQSSNQANLTFRQETL